MRCEICDNHEEQVGELLDNVCRLCNPDSHAEVDKEEAEQLETELWKQ